MDSISAASASFNSAEGGVERLQNAKELLDKRRKLSDECASLKGLMEIFFKFPISSHTLPSINNLADDIRMYKHALINCQIGREEKWSRSSVPDVPIQAIEEDQIVQLRRIFEGLSPSSLKNSSFLLTNQEIRVFDFLERTFTIFRSIYDPLLTIAQMNDLSTMYRLVIQSGLQVNMYFYSLNYD